MPGAAPAQQRPPARTERAEPDTAELRRRAEQRLGRSISQAEILERLRQSGMTRSQIRTRLQQMGYDPGLADRYFDALERGGEPPEDEPSERFIEALGELGLMRLRMLPDSLAADSLEVPLTAEDSLRLLEEEADTLETDELEVFGLRTFRRAGTQFQPVTFGPVDPGYRLGPGDEILLVLTGDVEAAYALDVSREGFLFIPDVGQVSVNGLTLAQLEDQLYSRLGRVYSGVSRSPNATTRFQVSVGALRVNQVAVTGDVVRPGSYQVSSVGGLFNALYQAGGPTAEGSFRHIEVHRGGRLHHVADLYDFLVRGDGASDVRLEHNDRIFVPPAGAQARVEGAVRRPAIYEVKPGEGIRDLLAFAGGPSSDAMLRRVQIDRIVPPAEQRPGYYRTLVDVPLAELMAAGPSQRITDGDVVTVFTVSDLRRNRIWLDGEVHNPGIYEWNAGSTLWSLLERADGLADEAYTSRAHVYRLVERDGSRRLLQVSLERDDAGRPIHDLPLADNDSIVVFSNRELRTEEFVSIDGFVKEPDMYPLARGMTLRDLILAAQGFAHGAYVLEAEISREADPTRRTDTTAYIFRVPLAAPGSDGATLGAGEVPRWLPEATEVVLQHGDRVFVRAAPGYEPVRQVHITGQVLAPGAYVLATRDERVVDVIRRAGGLTPQAYAPGMRVVREGHIVAADLSRALQRPRDPNNILLVAGDSIHVPVYDAMVTVTGAVNFEARVLYADGKGLDYYIRQAGGFTDQADRNRTTVTYANGERSAVSRGLFFGRHTPRVAPGSQVFVPAKGEQTGTNWDQVFGRVSAIIGAVATAIIAYSQLK